jgi:hypothetical protein
MRTINAVATDGHEEILNHASYYANGAEVIVLTRDPGAAPTLMFGLPNHDHAVVAILNCTMERLSTKPLAGKVAFLPRAGTLGGVPAAPA